MTLHTIHYILEKYTGPKSRFKCPSCGKTGQFTKYIHTETYEYLHHSVGICNRINNCGYHYAPKQYFCDHPTIINNSQRTSTTSNNKPQQPGQRTCWKEQPTSFIPIELFSKSLTGYGKNNFVLGLEQLFDRQLASQLVQLFCIGTAKKPSNGTVFWQLDEHLRVRTGKIMLYNSSTLKRIKNCVLQQNSNKPLTPVDWVHSRLLREKKLPTFQLAQCLFGLHQLQKDNQSLPIGIVESEKTAVIATVFMPDFIWMATGGAQNLSLNMLAPLKGRRVVLFPDVNQYGLWQTKAVNIEKETGLDISISDFMELNATENMRQNGADLADVLIKRDNVTRHALSDFNYPVSWNVDLEKKVKNVQMLNNPISITC